MRFRQRADLNFVRNPAHRCVVKQQLRRQVGHIDQGDVERHADLAAAVQGQVIGTGIERCAETVEQVGTGQALAAQVVDDEHAIVGHEVGRRVVDPAGRVMPQVQHIGRQFRANLYQRPLAQRPAAVARAPLFALADLGKRRQMKQRIMHEHDIVTGKDGVRHGNDALLQLPQLARQHALAAAGRPMQQH
jgi:2,4-dienoyl-CoA reductase-like NADH-dependent reductase (Old Yellow Enzyme family)